MKAYKIDKPLPSLEDFVGEELILEEPRKKKLAREKKERELKSGESAIEEKMKKHMIRLMKANDAPLEQYERLGLE